MLNENKMYKLFRSGPVYMYMYIQVARVPRLIQQKSSITCVHVKKFTPFTYDYSWEGLTFIKLTLSIELLIVPPLK